MAQTGVARGSHFYPQSFQVLYRGSVKDLRGPVDCVEPASSLPASGLVFDYTDSYSVFDWGRMPDQLPSKGQALAVIAAHWFEKLEKPETWKEYSRNPLATVLRKGNRFGAIFNEVCEELQRTGLRTHYLGLLSEAQGAHQMVPGAMRPLTLTEITQASRHLAVKQVAVVKPVLCNVLGRQIPDYSLLREARAPKLVPLEVVFRFGCPPGSSLIDRAKRDPDYMSSIGFSGYKVGEGEKWDFPVLELFTKLESTDRPLTLTEALSLSGLTGAQMEKLLLRTAWIAGWLKAECDRSGIELADGKLEWAVTGNGDLMLVDAIGPDELRLLREGVQLSKEFLRHHYRDSSWYRAVGRAKQIAKDQGVAEWKKFSSEQPQPLPSHVRELGSQLYQALANQITGRNWFPSAWPLDKVVHAIVGLGGETSK